MNLQDIDQIAQAFTNHGPAIQAALVGYAYDLLYALTAIEVVFSMGRSLIHRSDTAEMLALGAHHLITWGFYYWLISNWTNFAADIINGGAQLGGIASQAAGGMPNMTPTAMASAGITMAKNVWAAISITKPAMSVLLVAAGLIVVGVFAWITALMIEIIIESFIASCWGGFALAFGGNVYTRDIAIAQARYALAVAAKRFVMQLIAGLGQGIVTGWANGMAADQAFTWADIAVMVCVPIVMLRLVQRLPNIAQDVVMGTHMSTSGSLFGAAAGVAAGATAVAVTTTGVGAAAVGGMKVAAADLASQKAAGTAPASRISQAAMMAGTAARETGRAVMADVGSRLNGTYGARHGHSTWRVATRLNNRANEISAKGKTP
jgi:P-type conjugative transfer protein TrbL